MITNQIPVKPAPDRLVGEIVSVEVVAGDYGKQIQVTLDPVPAAEFHRQFWFTYSAKGSSKWMRFVTSFNQSIGREIDAADELVGEIVEIVEHERSGEIRGEARTWTEPVVVTVFMDRDEAMAAVEQPVSNTPGTAAPDSVPPTLESMSGLLTQVYEATGRDPDRFFAQVKGFGFSRDAVLNIVQGKKR